METKKIILLVLGLGLVYCLQAQTISEDRTGYFRAQGNIAVGYLFAERQPGAYVQGDMDFFIKNQISINGAIWYFIPVTRSPLGIKANHSLLWGFNYHFLKTGRADPVIGLTPGVSLVRVAYADAENTVKLTPYGPAPLFSVAVGCNYYVGTIFNFYIKAQGMAGEFFGNAPQPSPLYELRLTAGLGFDAHFWKPGAAKRLVQKHTTEYGPELL